MDNSVIDMIVEIPRNSNVKYEYDKESNLMRCDRIISTAMLYPGNYGYVPDTLSGDGDPLDILLLCDYPIYPGTVIKVKTIGVLLTEDEKGDDEKLIAIPSHEVDQSSMTINCLEDLGAHILNKIKHFFQHYKDNETQKWVHVKDFADQNEALSIIERARKRFTKPQFTTESDHHLTIPI